MNTTRSIKPAAAGFAGKPDEPGAAGPANPAPLRVRMPGGGILPPEGAEVTWSPYWQRRLAEGDVVEVKAAAAARRKPSDKE